MVDRNEQQAGEGRRDEELCFRFRVITDTHVRADEQHTHNVNLERALQDIAANGTGSVGIMHAGDVTDHGFPDEYEAWNRNWHRFGGAVPPLYVTMGNHDVALENWEARLGQFLRGTGAEGIYHDHWIDGYHFIFLGTEEGLELFSSLSEKQLAWLDDKLGKTLRQTARFSSSCISRCLTRSPAPTKRSAGTALCRMRISVPCWPVTRRRFSLRGIPIGSWMPLTLLMVWRARAGDVQCRFGRRPVDRRRRTQGRQPRLLRRSLSRPCPRTRSGLYPRRMDGVRTVSGGVSAGVAGDWKSGGRMVNSNIL